MQISGQAKVFGHRGKMLFPGLKHQWSFSAYPLGKLSQITFSRVHKDNRKYNVIDQLYWHAHNTQQETRLVCNLTRKIYPNINNLFLIPLQVRSDGSLVTLWPLYIYIYIQRSQCTFLTIDRKLLTVNRYLQQPITTMNTIT